MSTRATWVHEMAARIKGVPGWKVTRSDVGYKVVAPDKVIIPMHLTSSDNHAYRLMMQALDVHGFTRDEQRELRRKERERQRKLIEDQAENDKAMKRTLARARSVAAAAGPYATLEPDILWLLDDHPAPAARKMMLTPEVCDKLLAFNTHNRPMKPNTTRKWQRRFTEGRYRLTHQGIGLANGVVVDGQHRLQASVNTGTSFETFVVVGLDPEAYSAVDAGSPRSNADALATNGEKSAAIKAAAARLVYLYDHVAPNLWRTLGAEMDEVSAAFEEDPVGYREAAQAASALTAKKISIVSSAGVAGIYLLRRYNKREIVDEWLHGLMTGADLHDGDPRIALARVVMAGTPMGTHRRRRRDAVEHLFYFITAWNKWNAGEAVNHLVRRRGAEFPRVSIRG